MKFFMFGLLFALSLNCSAEVVAKPAPVNPDDMRCGKIMGKSLGEFKTDLVEACDLNKPFSTSLSRVLNDETYFYCCHKKK